jgi:hypothetical protein
MLTREIYGMMMVGMMLLMAGCSTDDVVNETTSAQGIAISFSCNYDNEEENETRAADQDATGITRTGQQGAMNTEDLYASGFGVMASVTAGNAAPYDNKPNLMYNQEVKYTFVGDLPLNPEIQPDPEPYRGYWSYYPLKYWPTDLEHCYISAYAPYVEPTDLEGLPADETGIIGTSANNVAPYITYRRCETPASNVDLLWYYKKFESTDKIPEATTTLPAGTLNMKMRHALARLEIQVALAAPPSSGTKVLIESITLTGTMTKTAKLILNDETVVEGKHYPKWQALETPDVETRTIIIHNKDNDAGSYGIIDAQVRYIEGLPYDWQPKGLKKYTPPIDAKNNGMQNALSTGDRVGYIYLIPQDELELTVEVKYHQMTSGSHKKTTTSSTVHIPPKPSEEAPYPPLKGNTTYTLKLTLKEIL